jgi:hypothetical protein
VPAAASAPLTSVSPNIFTNNFLSLAIRCKNFKCVAQIYQCDRAFSTYSAV